MVRKQAGLEHKAIHVRVPGGSTTKPPAHIHINKSTTWVTPCRKQLACRQHFQMADIYTCIVGGYIVVWKIVKFGMALTYFRNVGNDRDEAGNYS